MKTKLAYTVRSTRAPGETRDTIVPVIVERLNPVELETVVENCIDRGLIAGLKTTAAHGIAEGVAAQIAREFSQGRGVQFGQYFYGRPYLSGTVDANGRLTSDNRINVRLYKGEAFRLTLDDFSFTFDGAGDAVKIDSVYGDTTSAGGNTYGQVVQGAPVKINGRNLYAAGDTDKVTFAEAGGGATIEVTDFATQSADMLSFAWPAGLVPGKTYTVRVERTDVNGVTRTGTGRKVAVVAGAVPPGPEPEPIAESADGTVKIMTLTDGGQSETFTAGHTWAMTGEGLFTEAAEGRRWRLGMAGITIPGVESAMLAAVTSAADGKSATLALESFSELPPAGTYANATLTIPLVSESDPGAEDTLEIPITFVVEE